MSSQASSPVCACVCVCVFVCVCAVVSEAVVRGKLILLALILLPLILT
jgi:hypothetical protein